MKKEIKKEIKNLENEYYVENDKIEYYGYEKGEELIQKKGETDDDFKKEKKKWV